MRGYCDRVIFVVNIVWPIRSSIVRGADGDKVIRRGWGYCFISRLILFYSGDRMFMRAGRRSRAGSLSSPANEMPNPPRLGVSGKYSFFSGIWIVVSLKVLSREKKTLHPSNLEKIIKEREGLYFFFYLFAIG